jgi:hypothetical protein
MRQLSDLADRGVSLAPKGSDFVRSLMAVAISKGDSSDASAYAATRWGPRTAAVTKAAVEALTTSSAASADLVAFQGAATEFFNTVSERSIIGRLSGLRRQPFYTRTLVSTEAVGHWVGEGQGKPLTRMAFGKSVLQPRKVVALTVATMELLRDSSPAAESVIRAELIRAVLEVLDTSFIDPANAGVDGITPASVTTDVSPVNSTAAHDADPASLVGGFGGDLTTSHIILAPETALTLVSTDRPGIGARGGSWAGIPLVVSRYVPAGIAVLIDAAAVALAEDPGELRTYTQGDVLMTDDAVMASAEMGSPQTPLPASLVSLWQTDSAALVAARAMNWAVVRPFSVSVLDGIGAGSP